MGVIRIKRSVNLDSDMAIWIKDRAKALSTSENTIIRQALRAAMREAAARQAEAADAAPAGGEEQG